MVFVNGAVIFFAISFSLFPFPMPLALISRLLFVGIIFYKGIGGDGGGGLTTALERLVGRVFSSMRDGFPMFCSHFNEAPDGGYRGSESFRLLEVSDIFE